MSKTFKYIIPLFLGLIGVTFFLPEKTSTFELPEKVDFNYHIRPILATNCFVCHGNDPDSREAGLRLDTEQGAKVLLESGNHAIVAGSARKSSLITRISSENPEEQMPPPESKRTLSPREIALLELWIDQGAVWQPHWAFVKPIWPKDLAEEPRSGTKSIDALIEQKLKSNKLSAVAPAAKNALIRRASYLTTGLPPTSEEIRSFISDTSTNAFARVVDGYLDSPAFGEHWARHWMDLVRYGETMGHEFDFYIGHAWQYRDYLIRAFNTDVPYDLLVKEHIAGDLLPTKRIHTDEGFIESELGTAYFYLGEGKHSPVDPKLEESDRIENMIDVTSKTFQALTVACAKCHDHKFDPIPTADYYAMYGMLESSRIVPRPARKSPTQMSKVEQLDSIADTLRNQIATLLQKKHSLRDDTDPNASNPEYRPKPDTSFKVMVDFREGTDPGWYRDGLAFGSGPYLGQLAIDATQQTIEGVINGCVSSRVTGRGLQGSLHSPNFIIDSDYITVKARGQHGVIRIVIDNFQVIRAPLWGKLEFNVDDAAWRTYEFDLRLAQGHKAYLQFSPGQYHTHVYCIKPDDYIEVAFAVSHDTGLNMGHAFFDDKEYVITKQKQALLDWVAGRASNKQAAFIDQLVQNLNSSELVAIQGSVKRYSDIARELYDSTSFVGLTEGEAILSPIFIRGSRHNLSEEKIPHRFLTAVTTEEKKFPHEGSGRLQWAEAVVDQDNPLTARVMVNRIWHHLFGRGIVASVDNFGLQGALPTHPELLDFLALQFVKEGWSIKKMIRMIMLSQTFQRSTTTLDKNLARDPENIYLHHFPIRRLQAESIRDGILATAGCLNTKMYGPSVPVHLTEFMTGRGKPKFSGPLDGEGRRSIYTIVRRNFMPPLMLAFDTPMPFSTFGRRNTTNVPAQSLTLLNDPFVHEQAEFWAENLIKNEATLEGRINSIYLSAFAREPLSEEIDAAKEFLIHQAQNYKTTLDQAADDVRIWKDYCHSVINLKEFIYLL